MIKYTTFCQWRLEDKNGDLYGPRNVLQTSDPEAAAQRFKDLVKLFKDNIKQGDCHIELVANIDAKVPKA